MDDPLVKDSPILVLFDDQCPLCTGEINHYRKLVKHQPVEWVGISKNAQLIEQLGYTREELLRRLHVVRQDGVVVKGAAAFAAIWSSLKYYRLASTLVYKLKLIPLLDFFYRRFWVSRHRRCANRYFST